MLMTRRTTSRKFIKGNCVALPPFQRQYYVRLFSFQFLPIFSRKLCCCETVFHPTKSTCQKIIVNCRFQGHNLKKCVKWASNQQSHVLSSIFVLHETLEVKNFMAL